MKQINLSKSKILLTGGTGSFGQAFTEYVLKHNPPKILRIFSRDEHKQFKMEQVYQNSSVLRFFIGDVRDRARLRYAMADVDIVIHAAALKQVPICEYNPFEAIKTNVLGTQNVIETAIDCGVKKALLISSDKAAAPLNLYGATKLCAEKIFVQSNTYALKQKTHLSVVRYGNVLASRGSVVPLFFKQRATGKLTITDKKMTRFWVMLPQAVEFVLQAFAKMQGGEIFVPKLPSVKIIDIAKAIAPGAKQKIIGIRPGEKLHETLITNEESRQTLSVKDFYLIRPAFKFWQAKNWLSGKKLPQNFSYQSNTNKHWLSPKDLKKQFNQN